jgi:hypothetical protein
MYLGTVDHIWNSNYLGGRGRILDWGLRSVQGKVIKTLSGNKAGVGTMAQTYKHSFLETAWEDLSLKPAWEKHKTLAEKTNWKKSKKNWG